MPNRFIFLTWLLALPVNTIAIVLAVSLNNWMQYGHIPTHPVLPDFHGVIAIAIFSIPFSIPGLLGLMMVVWIAREFLSGIRTQFIFICLCSCFLTAGCYLLLEYVISPGLQVKEYGVLLTASIVAILTVLLFTRKYYYSYLKSLS
jgi:hypothetical protein